LDAGFAVVFTFLFHLSFFSGCVAISGYCEQKNLHSVICCPVQPLSKSGEFNTIKKSLVADFALMPSFPSSDSTTCLGRQLRERRTADARFPNNLSRHALRVYAHLT
jgi:hypothetical protein